MSTSVIAQFETGHADAVHDAAFDYYGKRLATCSSDQGIKIFDVVGDQVTHLADLVGHSGPVWEVSWAHPKFGTVLASAGCDGTVVVWKEVSEGAWQQVYVSNVHSASVNSVAWAPYELGLAFAAASSDGSISIVSYAPDGSWGVERIDAAHAAGVNAVSWAPPAPRGSLGSSAPPAGAVRRLASAGCDAAVRVWVHDAARGAWRADGPPLLGHADWVRDVAWAPSLGLPCNTLASAGQDGSLCIWSEGDDGAWARTALPVPAGVPVWRVSWSVSGNVLAASDANSTTTLWREGTDREWVQLEA